MAIGLSHLILLSSKARSSETDWFLARNMIFSNEK